MSERRVVVTGAAGVCGLGNDWAQVGEGLRRGRSGIAPWPPLDTVEGMRTRLGGAVDEPPLPADAPRKKLRGMGRVSRLATWAVGEAIAASGLEQSLLSGGRTGLAFGSTSGSPPDMVTFALAYGAERRQKGITPMNYVKLMSHTCAANLAQYFEVRGTVLATTSACTSGSQAIGSGYEQIRFGRQEVMVCGGAEELHEIEVGVFDMMFATSTRNEAPTETPRPFDVDRDGLVVAEGAGALVLESLDHARERGAPILGELLGYATNCDGAHLTAPDPAGMEAAMCAGLADAGISADRVDYVCAHATATEAGDVAESHAMARAYGGHTPVSSLKGHLGHSLGACGALEAWMTLEMMREGWVAPTHNLERVDPACAQLDYVMGGPREAALEIAVSNNSAFGGINTSLVFGRFES
ncbi:MAG: beta-ketoacyl-ACP synthase II [Deltaproteobacteria bacterium]|jgi:3-oxoacyl-[acyl-carrier-protein] synthase II|nr:beta-ketoacyl-ACP synthase II [Deltaproteobacteria bacterium]